MKYFESLKKITNPFLIFLPFLIFYIFLVLKSPTHGTFGDEPRYLYFAQNLTKGYYSPPGGELNLWNGPGYPIALIPFVLLHLPFISITIFNAVLYYLSIILLFKTFKHFFSFQTALIVGFVWACYINSYGEMKVIYSEVVTSFSICLLLFCLVRTFAFQKRSKFYGIASGVIIGFIVLTKVIFGYVILAMLICTVAIWLFNRKSLSYRRGVMIMTVALATIIPYLVYTYSITGKVYYLGNSGGMSLYWMTAPDENELGDWYSEISVRQVDISSKIDSDTKMLPGFNNYLYNNHYKDYVEINKFAGVGRDDAYKRIALNNIKHNPVKYLKNCISNTERLLFSFPYSYTLEHTIMQVAVNGPLVFLMFFSAILTLLTWRNISYLLKFMLLFMTIYFVLTIMVSTYTRMFTIMVPMILFWITLVLRKSVRLKINFE